MNVSVEISLYPLADDYIGPIREFIARLQAEPHIEVLPNTMSTQVFGPYERVMAVLAKALKATHQKTPKAAFVLKILNGDLSG